MNLNTGTWPYPAGIYPNYGGHPYPTICPNCGYCPHCGHNNRPSEPIYPQKTWIGDPPIQRPTTGETLYGKLR